MKLMFKYIMKNRLLMTFNIIGLFCFALVELGIPTVASKIIDDGIAKQDIAYVVDGVDYSNFGSYRQCGNCTADLCIFKNFNQCGQRHPQ